MGTRKLLIAILLVGWGAVVAAAQSTSLEAISYLQDQWAVANYELSGQEQEDAYVALISEADDLVQKYPDAASVIIWRGIIQSTFAGAKGGLGALKLAKAAKSDLEKAISINGEALNGSAYTSLGTLYFSVPGWPIGFGDDETAEELLKKALELNPNGIDSNYFYGHFLSTEKRYEDARKHLQKALEAAPRPDRELADRGRREEIKGLMLKLGEKLD